MERKKEYSSFEEINLDLQIFHIEKEIALSKILRTIDDTKAEVKYSLQPINMIKSVLLNLSSLYNSNNIKTLLTTYGINFLLGKLNK